MASTDGQAPDSLIEALAAKPYAFDFCQAVRRLQARHPELPPVGYSQSPAQDPVRFAQNASLAFAPASLDRLELRAEGLPPRLWVNCFGLLGPNGPLPVHLTEYARERKLHHGDHTFNAFLNVFQHRLTSFFFRAWADNQKSVDLDRPENQRFAIYLGGLFGAGMDSLRRRDALPEHAKLYYSGRLASQTRCAEGLEAILSDYFGVPTEVQPLAGRWMKIPPGAVCQLGAARETGQLGVNTLVGSRFWECQLNFRIQMGPMKWKDFERLLPSGRAFERLRCWVRQYTGDEFFWDLKLVLAREEVPQTSLGKQGRLGWTTWLKTQPFKHDAEDLVIQPPDQQSI